jgi:hypothetical protein
VPSTGVAAQVREHRDGVHESLGRHDRRTQDEVIGRALRPSRAVARLVDEGMQPDI